MSEHLGTESLVQGDRAPDFMLPDQHRQVDPFYTLVQGGHILLHFFPGFGKPSDERELKRIAAKSDALKQAGVEVYAIALGDFAANCKAALDRKLPFEVFTDPQGAVHERYGLMAHHLGSKPDIVTYLLDPNQRVLAAFTEGAKPQVDRVLATLAKTKAEPPRTITRTAPVLLIPGVLDRPFCAKLIDIWHSHNEPSGTITMGEKGDATKADRDQVKRRRDHHVRDKDLFEEIEARVFARVAPEIFTAYDREVEGVEEFKIVRYDSEEGGFFRPHRDNVVPDMAHRRFAMTLNLNTEDYEGGDLRFPEYGPDLYRPGTGDAVIFSCSLLHEAMDVTKGERFTLLSFILDGQPEQWRQERREWFDEERRSIEAGLAQRRGAAVR